MFLWKDKESILKDSLTSEPAPPSDFINVLKCHDKYINELTHH